MTWYLKSAGERERETSVETKWPRSELKLHVMVFYIPAKEMATELFQQA